VVNVLADLFADTFFMCKNKPYEKMKKSILYILLVSFLALGLASCYENPRTAWTPKEYKKKKVNNSRWRD